DPKLINQQLKLFDSSDPNRINLCKTMDLINQRYGDFSLSPARLVHRSKMPNVIAPAWKPSGHRQTI
ncbi:MAG: DNA polymerase IV, partial [Pseudomonadota bacterium]|nr:DNA polymerase IV [Pseudomonadota bacterium]